ncbi:hypothetical protein IT774_11010 [Salinimonas marina]|uniref:Porin domain-containing protein n=1 Tax=Salinimonas marina TaxID=2785918 RepID=A0A7S9HF08_9ALTE|nr:hypothetical protein IT774_11010 [Salinimonas marina]
MIGSLLLLVCSNSYAGNDDLELSGFARVVGGYLDASSVSYEGYDNSISFSEKSLVALQADYRLNTSLSVSAQLLLHSDEDRESGIEWLYLTYMPTKALQFNAGRLRTPFLKYSDVIDVGFSYPWVMAPQQLYSSYLFSQYEGVNARYRTGFNGINFDFEAYYGQYDGDLHTGGQNVDVDVDGMFGGVIELNYKGFQLRASSTNGSNVSAEIEELEPLLQALNAAGFDDIAESLDIDDKASAYLFGASYDSINGYISGEWMKVSSDTEIFADIKSYYVSGGYYIDNVLLHATYAVSSQSINIIDNTIPTGISPQLDALHNSIDQVNDFFQPGDFHSFTVGARWDFKHHMALKGEVSFLNNKDGQTSYLELQPGKEMFDRRATLYQVALEWVF